MKQMKRLYLLLSRDILCFRRPDKAANAETNEVRIGWQPAAWFEFFYAQQEKLFEGRPQTNLREVHLDPAMLGVQGRDLDIAFEECLAYVAGVDEGMDVFALCWLETVNTSLIMQPSEEITSANAGGKENCVINGLRAIHLLKYLNAEKIPLKDVSLVYMSIPSLLPAFANKDVDGVSVWEPWASS